MSLSHSVLSLTLMLHADPSHKCYHLLQCTGREGRGGEERRGEERGGGKRRVGLGVESKVSTGQQ